MPDSATPDQVSGSPPDSESEASLWAQYRRTGEPRLRARLITTYQALTHGIAARLFGQRINDSMAFDDYLQYARVGLLEAIDHFDPSRGDATFATFASYRIRGSILNGLEKATEASAQSAQRRRARLRERTQSVGQLSSDSRPHRVLDFTGMVDVAILLAMGYVLEDSGQWNPAGADSGNHPYRSVQLERLRTRLKRLVDVLPERERTIVRWHYFEHMEFQDIGATLGISKGRVSQLHARALQLIREGNESLDQFELDL